MKRRPTDVVVAVKRRGGYLGSDAAGGYWCCEVEAREGSVVRCEEEIVRALTMQTS